MAIISQSPDNFATDVVRNVFIRVDFDVALEYSSITEYTVFLLNTATHASIECSIDYIIGTKAITIQLFDFLTADTNYTVIIMGGTGGVKEQFTNDPFSTSNYIFSFTTGDTIDWQIPLANKDDVIGEGSTFTGADGIYKDVYGRTGEPISHIVTTSAQVGPSGTIVPAPWGAERYLQASGLVPGEGVAFALTSSDPEDEDINVEASGVLFTFNSTLESIGSSSIEVSNILETELIAENLSTNYDFTIDAKTYAIGVNDTLEDFAYSAVYTVTLSDIVDIVGNTIDLVDISFRTKISPLYSTVRLIRSLGQLIEAETDDTIRLLIYENSLWIFENAAPAFDTTEVPQAAKDYVTCKTKMDLIERRFLQGGQITRKSLADLTIEYGAALASVIQRIMDNLEKCINRNLTTLGAGTPFVEAVSAIKSKSDPRMPIDGDSWVRLSSEDFT